MSAWRLADNFWGCGGESLGGSGGPSPAVMLTTGEGVLFVAVCAGTLVSLRWERSLKSQEAMSPSMPWVDRGQLG